MGTTDKDYLFNQAVQEAFDKLPQEDQENIDYLVRILCKKIRKMGTLGALELLAKVGIFQIKKTKEMIDLLHIIENHKQGSELWETQKLLLLTK